MTLYYADCYAIPLPPGHKFPMEKYRLVRDRLAACGGFQFSEAPFADPAVIALAHDPGYVSAFLDGTLEPAIVRRIGFPWSEGLVRRTLASVGGTLMAAEDALRRGFGGNLAGGTHHALYDTGAGFCVFNDIAVAIRRLLHEGRVERAAVVDLDVHQGDGTAALFASDRRVLTLSIHGRNNFPLRKQRSTIDIELDDGTEDAAYLAALAGALPRVFAFEPDIVFFQTGVDALATDTLGRLALTHDGLRARDRMVIGHCRERGIPLAATLGGGYSKPIDPTVEAHANTFRVAARIG
ncbi:MAG: histone deacetylase [Bryobacterales bacterium]|nr:histone deacetylase [Bryobacterales bacterium]